MSETAKPPGHDIFCTPENSDFVSKVPYQSLSKTDQEIRLLKILPDSGSGFVECELLPAVPLASVHEQYLALSYCAGSAKNTKPIKVNGVNSNVFANLHHALTSARHYWETNAELPEFLLWIDQICINQFDLAERSHQVGFMRNIYHNAKRTLVCLSTCETNGEGMAWLIELSDIAARKMIQGLTHCLSLEFDREEFEKGLSDYFDIVRSPWWRRAWVFQEFMVSTHITFLHGKYAMAHLDFRKMMDVCGHFLADTEILGYYHYATHLLTAKRYNPALSDLESLLLFTQECGATDRRDRIYSVLGLANPGYGITPDYSPENDMRKLLVDTTKKIITFEDSLSILSLLIREDGPKNPKELLPSWVIDWEHVFVLTGLWNQLVRKPTMGYFTDYKKTTGSFEVFFVEVPHPERPETTTTTLQVWAILLDTSFEKSEDCGRHNKCRYEGSRHYIVETSDPFEGDQELWILCGAREPFLLSRYSNGYQISFESRCINPLAEGRLSLVPPPRVNPVEEDGMWKFFHFWKFPEFMDDQGAYDTNKMNWKKITLF